MANKEYEMDVDDLALGLTKSPMFMGVNIRIFFANIVIGALIFIDVHSFLGIPLCLGLHLMLVKLSVKEPNFLSIWIRAFIKTPPVLNNWYWGKTNSYEPW